MTAVEARTNSGIVPGMGKKTKIGLGLAVGLLMVAGIVLHLSGDRILRSVAIGRIGKITGFGVELGGLEVDLRQRTLEFTDLRLTNPAPFTEPDAIHLSRVFAALSWDALLGRRTWLTRLDLEIASLNIIRPREGLSNLEVLGRNAEAWEAAQEGTAAPEAHAPALVVTAGWGMTHRPRQVDPVNATTSEPDLQIDELHIRIGEVHVIDYRLGRYEPVRFSSELNREKTYLHVTDLDALGEEIAIDFGVDAIVDQLGELEQTFPGLADGVKDFLRQANTPGSEEAEKVDNAVEQLQDALNRLFK